MAERPAQFVVVVVGRFVSRSSDGGERGGRGVGAVVCFASSHV